MPYPIIVGSNQPQLRLHGETHYSLTNRSLFVPESHIDQDGTYPLSAFLLERVSPTGLPADQPVQLSTEQAIPWCRGCHFRPCPMIVKDSSARTVKRELDQSGASYQPLILSSDLNPWETPRFDLCPAISCLLDLCQTDTERKFLQRYYELVFGGWIEPEEGLFFWEGMVNYRSAWLEEWYHRQSELPPAYRDPGHVSSSILRGLTAPVLLPKLWVNYEFGAQAEDENPSPGRVDFAWFFRGQKHAIEIDGRSHYSRWDETRRCYIADAERYTATLQSDRYLRRRGRQVHRFSNDEVDQAEIKRLPSGGTDMTFYIRLLYDIAFELFGGDYHHYPQPRLELMLPQS